MERSTPSRPIAATPNGVLIVDKPRGPTSHDVVARVRRALKTRHVGHAGTLDPMATGVLVVAVGEATKLVPWLTADDKTYEATIRLGVETDTLDAEGAETGRVPVPEAVARAVAEGAADALLDAALAQERSRTAQVPPAFSAIRVAGQRAHELARAGLLEADLPERPVEVRALDVLGGRADETGIELDVRVEAAKGYFVRSLARDLARGLGTVGHLTALRRIRSGAFTVADAVALDAASAGALMSVSEAAARALPVTVLDEAGVRAVSFGQRVAPEQMTSAHACASAWLDPASRLVAVGACGPDGWGRVLRGFPQGA
ncbi:MAG: tRNA pseudouridine(55) synthase TruB [Labilithrix sp.]|nr:tRNA pseudouridine(55) synthase TruB [Labilithrix sp.]